MEHDTLATECLAQIPLPLQRVVKKENWPDIIEASSKSLLRNLSKIAEDMTNSVKLPPSSERIALFFSARPADIPASSYLERLHRYVKCSPSAIIYAIIYLSRVKTANKLMCISALTMHRMLITSIAIAAKFLDMAWYSNAYYAKVGGIPTVQEMNRLELEFLRLSDYRTYVLLDEFEEMVALGFKCETSVPTPSTTRRMARL